LGDCGGLFSSHLQQNLGELLSRQLPYDAFHLQVKKGSQNFVGIQPGRFNNVVNMTGLFGA
jgi:hypothetical protein